MVKKKKQVQMVFLPSSRAQQGIDRLGVRDTLKEFTSHLKGFKDWFSGYEIDTIELKDGYYFKNITQDSIRLRCNHIYAPKSTITKKSNVMLNF